MYSICKFWCFGQSILVHRSFVWVETIFWKILGANVSPWSSLDLQGEDGQGSLLFQHSLVDEGNEFPLDLKAKIQKINWEIDQKSGITGLLYIKTITQVG